MTVNEKLIKKNFFLMNSGRRVSMMFADNIVVCKSREQVEER